MQILSQLINESKNIIHQLKKQTFKQKTVPENETFLYEYEFFTVDKYIPFKNLLTFDINNINIPFSSIK